MTSLPPVIPSVPFVTTGLPLNKITSFLSIVTLNQSPPILPVQSSKYF